MRSIFLRHIVMSTVALSAVACSNMEYAANRSHYQITTSPTLNAASSSINKEQPKLKDEDAFVPERPKTTPVLSITKKDPKSLGNFYFQNGFSTTKNDLVFEIRKEKGGYKALTPFLFNSQDFNSNLSLSATSHASLMAGIEFKIPFGKFK